MVWQNSNLDVPEIHEGVSEEFAKVSFIKQRAKEGI